MCCITSCSERMRGGSGRYAAEVSCGNAAAGREKERECAQAGRWILLRRRRGARSSSDEFHSSFVGARKLPAPAVIFRDAQLHAPPLQSNPPRNAPYLTAPTEWIAYSGLSSRTGSVSGRLSGRRRRGISAASGRMGYGLRRPKGFIPLESRTLTRALFVGGGRKIRQPVVSDWHGGLFVFISFGREGWSGRRRGRSRW